MYNCATMDKLQLLKQAFLDKDILTIAIFQPGYTGVLFSQFLKYFL